MTSQKDLFPRGRLLATPRVVDAVDVEKDGRNQLNVFSVRHKVGDWGDVSPLGVQANEGALAKGRRIVSSYQTKGGVVVWIVTEANRETTTIYLASEYSGE